MSAHVMAPGGYGHGLSHCINCKATDREIAFALGPDCPKPSTADTPPPTEPLSSRIEALRLDLDAVQAALKQAQAKGDGWEYADMDALGVVCLRHLPDFIAALRTNEAALATARAEGERAGMLAAADIVANWRPDQFYTLPTALRIAAHARPRASTPAPEENAHDRSGNA